MLAYIRKVTRSRDEGASAVEYGLLVAAIAALVVIIVFALGGLVQKVFQDTCSDIKTGAAKGTVDTSGTDCTKTN
jgi:pilus assembly protein Flp/PilA